MNRTVIVSNRLPPLDRDEASAGGLAVGISAALAESGGTWLGWDGQIDCEPDHGSRIQQITPYTIIALALSADEHAGYYIGFANRALWPVLHGRADLVRFDPADFALYRAVNARFAKQLAAAAHDADAVWVHDYHFLCMGEALRRLGIRLPIGFFLHVPFPPADTLAALPCHRNLIGALSAFDLVGLQSENDLRNFCDYATRYLGAAVSEDGTVAVGGRQFSVGVFPIGIDTRGFSALAESKEAGVLRERLRGCFEGQLGVIGVDRLDYTKGLERRFRAFERLLETSPAHFRQAFLLQIAAPSRMAIPEYAALRDRLEALSGRINARHARIDWTPVRYINRAFSQTRLAALYRLSRVGLVTPLRDGMNLVAKEFVAAQSANDPGVLVLSRYAGAAERLSGALLVNPYDIDGMAAAMRRALVMCLEERRERYREMISELRDHDVHGWREDYLRALVAAHRRSLAGGRQSAAPMSPRGQSVQQDGGVGRAGHGGHREADVVLARPSHGRRSDHDAACRRVH